MHIVGFGLKDAQTKQLKCAAQAGDGKYYDAQNAEGLGDVMDAATSQTVDDPEPNFTVYTSKNGKAVDAWVRASKVGSKKDITADRTYRDTADIYLPPGKYQIEIQALENSDLNSQNITIEIKKDENIHKNISFDAGKIFSSLA